ncbi:transposase InsO family protein [Bradyrhizobium sp. RT9a]
MSTSRTIVPPAHRPLPRASLRRSWGHSAPRTGPSHGPPERSSNPPASLDEEAAQYASRAYRDALTGANITASMSRRADCYDNAPMESFFHTLKTELVHHRDYSTRAEAQRDIFAFIEGFYNRTRLHSAIGYIAPIEMELKAA